MKKLDLFGKQFGKLKVLFLLSTRTKNGEAMWRCLCSCGKKVSVRAHDLKISTRSCGCLRGNEPIHGMSGTSIYNAWYNMRQRCEKPNRSHYKDYGGRGIKVCKRWCGELGFQNFFIDMGPKPSFKHSLERINNDGNYEPTNCKWATKSDQIKNRRPILSVQNFSDAALQAEVFRRTPEYGLSAC